MNMIIDFAIFSSVCVVLISLNKRKADKKGSMIGITSTNKEVQESSVTRNTFETTYSKLIGNTPIVKLEKLSELLKRNILIKVFMCSNFYVFSLHSSYLKSVNYLFTKNINPIRWKIITLGGLVKIVLYIIC